MVVDRLGTRRSFVLTVSLRSADNGAHAPAHSAGELIALRFLLGLGAGALYPAAMRTCAEWFLPQDRSKPIGLFLGGDSFGAAIAPVLMAGMREIPSPVPFPSPPFPGTRTRRTHGLLQTATRPGGHASNVKQW